MFWALKNVSEPVQDDTNPMLEVLKEMINFKVLAKPSFLLFAIRLHMLLRATFHKKSLAPFKAYLHARFQSTILQ
jgi:hypothetical protein